MPDIDIVIVNYTSGEHTLKCVDSLLAAAKADGVPMTVTVVDNGGDGPNFASRVPKNGLVTVLSNRSNVGFATACNAGAGRGTAPVIFFLNPDTRVPAGTLRGLVDLFNDPAHRAVGIAGPEIRDINGLLVRSCSRLPSTQDLILRTTGLHILMGARSGYPYLPIEAHNTCGPAGQVMGAALAIRRRLFDQLGGFDQRFFLYYEDVDLCARAAEAGAPCWYEKTVSVTHIGRGSSRHDNGRALALHLRSRLTYAGLHFGRATQAAVLVTSLIMEFPLRLVQALLGKGVLTPAGVLKAYGLLLRSTAQRADVIALAGERTAGMAGPGGSP